MPKPTQSIEIELNQLRSMVAQSASTIAALEAQLAERSDEGKAGESPKRAILDALAVADNGKPGHLSVAQIAAQCNSDKEAVHRHVNALEKEGKVWIRKTHYPKTHKEVSERGRPLFLIYHPKAVRT